MQMFKIYRKAVNRKFRLPIKYALSPECTCRLHFSNFINTHKPRTEFIIRLSYKNMKQNHNKPLYDNSAVRISVI